MKFDRRAMLGALPTAAFALSGAAPAARRHEQHTDVVVIGAGLAGLNAALNLEDLGVKAVVLEAHDKPGGRLHTLRGKSRTYDCGATTVGPEYGRVRALAERFGVPLVPPHRRGGLAMHFNGVMSAAGDWSGSAGNRTSGFERAISPAQLESVAINKFAKLPTPDAWRSAQGEQWDIPLDQFYRSAGLSDEAIRLIEISSNCETLATSSAVFQMKELMSLASWGQAGGQKNSVYEAGSGDFHYIAGGSDRLPEAISKGMKSEVRCNTVVTAIAMTDRGCIVTCEDGSRISCKYVISAVPFTALSRIAITPRPTGTRAESIADALYMGTTHFFFEVTEPYWKRDGLDPGLITDAAIERVFANIGQSGEVEWLDVWINGAGANRFDAMAPDAAAMFTTDTLYALRPSMKGAIRFAGMYSWANDRFVGGNKHIFRPGQVTRFANVMADPWMRLHFAGEHTRDVEPGMEAAAATGERAAFEILEIMGKA